jgi:hypothetical protein
MRTIVPTILVTLFFALMAQTPRSISLAPGPAASGCGPLGAAYMRTTLYFGLTRKGGSVSEPQWQNFLRDEVTPRFPQGLTVWEANGQWRRDDGRISREKAKVLLLVHEDTVPVRAALGEIVTSYKRAYEQESVLWETARVCAAF